LQSQWHHPELSSGHLLMFHHAPERHRLSWRLSQSEQTFRRIMFLSWTPGGQCKSHMNLIKRVLPQPVSPMIITGIPHLFIILFCSAFNPLTLYLTSIRYSPEAHVNSQDLLDVVIG
jgi:hypothetical protein